MSSSRAVTAPDGISTPVGIRIDEVRRAAAQLFAERGYSATTMSQIAEATGILPGSLYHYFASKEDIAVAILEQFNDQLDNLTDNLTPPGFDDNPDLRLRNLIHDVAQVSLGNAAAIRLRVFEPPTVASTHLARARTLDAPKLEREWKTRVDAVADAGPGRTRNSSLLRFALMTLSLDAGAHFPNNGNPDHVSHALGGLLLNGLAVDCPPDEELDQSEALRAARDAISTWPSESEEASNTDVRIRIIAAARSQFARRGYHATTIRDIAEAAGVQMATLYRRVESKEAILAQVITSFSQHLDTATRSALTTGNSEIASLDALAMVFLNARHRFREESDILRLAPPTNSLEGPLTKYSRETDARLKLLEGVLARGMSNGTIHRFDTPQAIAPHIRYLIWVPFQDFGRTSVARSTEFLRRTMLRGYSNL